MFEFVRNLFKSILGPNSMKSSSTDNKPECAPFDKEAFQMDDIKVYALSTCIHCRNAKKYLDECGVKYNCVHVDELKGDERKDIVKELKEHNPAVSFPTILIKDTVVVGYHKDKIDKALEKEGKK